jgi:CubicO group peptidase (beta-lactamase class C family)
MLHTPVDDAWPLGEGQRRRTGRKDMDVARVWSAVEAHFAATSLQARAFVVVRNGELLMEHYADGFDASTPLLGWSMTKSLMHALLAVRSKDAPTLLNLTSPIDLPEWVGDAKSQKTVRDFLQMRSGMSFDEYYTPGSDVLDMLFKRTSTWGPEMVERPLRDAEAAACFQYSSTTTNILARLLKLSFERFAHAPHRPLPHVAIFPVTTCQA